MTMLGEPVQTPKPPTPKKRMAYLSVEGNDPVSRYFNPESQVLVMHRPPGCTPSVCGYFKTEAEAREWVRNFGVTPPGGK
jgi:hypothetical protein